MKAGIILAAVLMGITGSSYAAGNCFENSRSDAGVKFYESKQKDQLSSPVDASRLRLSEAKRIDPASLKPLEKTRNKVPPKLQASVRDEKGQYQKRNEGLAGKESAAAVAGVGLIVGGALVVASGNPLGFGIILTGIIDIGAIAMRHYED